MRNKLYKIFAAGIALAMAFTLSCSSGGDDPPDGGGGGNGTGGDLSNKDPQVYYSSRENTPYTGSGVLKIRAGYDEDDNEILIDAGSVKNGIVNLELPSIPNEYLREKMNEGEENEGCNISPADSKMFQIDGLRLYDGNGNYIDKILGGHYYDADGNEYFSAYLYLSKATKITCDNRFKKIDIDAKAGWNRIYTKDPDSPYCDDFIPNGEEICKEIVSTNNFFTKELKWILDM